MSNLKIGNAFIRRISTEALASPAVTHPYLNALSSGDFPNVELAFKDFAHQYGEYSSKFTRCVLAVIEQLENPAHREILLENLAEEQGDTHEVELPPDVFASIIGQPHTLLFSRFQEAIGVDAAYREANAEIQLGLGWGQKFLKLCQKNCLVGVGAIGIGTERIVSSIYRQILDGIRTQTDLTMTERVFFDLHSECDEDHAAQMELIAADLASDRAACEQIEYGARMALQLRVEFWDSMLKRAANFAPAPYPDIEKLSVFGN